VWCHATGERIGSISGRFWEKLGESGASANTNHFWVKESDQFAVQAYMTPGNAGDKAGVAYSIPSDNLYGALLYNKTASAAGDYWDVTVAGASVVRFFTSTFRPVPDNTVSLGNAAGRWSTVFAGTGTINTSDARSKTDIADLDEAETRVAQRLKKLVKKYRFRDAVAEKGDKARIHVGVIAQDVQAAFEVEGLDPFAYSVLCFDKWEEQEAVTRSWSDEYDDDGNLIREAGIEVIEPAREAGDRYGIRYDELFAFILSAL
jgi:hypothetical protein